MEKKIDQQRFAPQNAAIISTQDNSEEIEVEEEEEEALSLSDLPIVHHTNSKQENNPLQNDVVQDDDFDFCSIISKQSEMCAADELFFQGQILPFRHSVSSDNGTRPVSRPESMDHYHSHSLPTRNQFHSHPSPSPKTRFPTNTTRRITHNKKTPAWNIFRIGLVTPGPPEFHDLKTRSSNYSTNCRNLGSRNSTSSNSSSFSSSNSEVKIVNSDKRKKLPRGLLSGCKCSVNAVGTVPSKVVFVKRSALKVEEEIVELPQVRQRQAAKKQMSQHRTFEWLKQLSIEGAPDR